MMGSSIMEMINDSNYGTTARLKLETRHVIKTIYFTSRYYHNTTSLHPESSQYDALIKISILSSISPPTEGKKKDLLGFHMRYHPIEVKQRRWFLPGTFNPQIMHPVGQ